MAVLLYHAGITWLPGGFLGVEVFFVISGFLITSLLVEEHERTQRINLKQFWMRRARRLLPALLFLLVVVCTYTALFLPDEAAKLRGDALAALTYCTNWYLIFSKQSYFAALGRPSLLRHLWSLAVEEQWYLVWPVVFAGAMRLARSRRPFGSSDRGGRAGLDIVDAAACSCPTRIRRACTTAPTRVPRDS